MSQGWKRSPKRWNIHLEFGRKGGQTLIESKNGPAFLQLPKTLYCNIGRAKMIFLENLKE